jgi:CheY-like chemotaxis protein
MDKKTILVVDDEQDVLSVLRAGLASNGYSIITAIDGEHALTLASSKQPDLIILDILMPGMDGPEVDRKLKDNPKTKDIPVIFLTSLYTKEEEHTSQYTAGNNMMFAKPYEMDDLLEGVESAIYSSKTV